ncbi:lysine N(6)-hydroxylase/L-ornithine N(5)-oxygenase family protein [Kitasatospora sp. NBC_01287]|uniref:lysine N(6)-hydroxylase/L-ornithine N(5)-oxygenase family protein n=1 Tax=Kitasatospora sp. NBC_01287 TaxID=2903573 RepID=UPI00224D44FD|nr:lysine N(6)-hydroxylase/L-ornithine N(5)-oxygenase family protein [Kitasatospora sp. NBC_01287]MCX4746937.1 lysine N(6)-hydroxylase/L-ornithine N(5)-oxygenase family protein [Kitasatospora sp. NBC_01287]
MNAPVNAPLSTPLDTPPTPRADARTNGEPAAPQPGGSVLDLLGIGFGPSNLAVAIAAAEHNARPGARRLETEFLEQKPAFSWHPGMLLEGATMQVSFLKDLATMRNPSSGFGFLAYLHAKDRLVDFINHKMLYPTRVEFHDYLRWCAEQLGHLVRYDHEVVSARPVEVAGTVTHFEVVARERHTGELVVRAARNLILAPGLDPRLPEGLQPSDRVWHSSVLLNRIGELAGTAPRRFVVLGAGQSAAEVTDYLYRAFPDAEVCAVFARYGYSQSDDSPLANRIFDPAAVDDFYHAPEDAKSELMRYHANTNYSVVDVDLIEGLYGSWYQEKVRNERRLRLLNMTSLVGAVPRGKGVEVTVRHAPTGATQALEADLLVCATGYRSTDPRTLLGEVGALLWTDERDRLVVDRDYRVATDPRVRGGVYLCGGTEHTHGITSSLLSNAAVRAGEILDSVLERAAADLPADGTAERQAERQLIGPVPTETRK